MSLIDTFREAVKNTSSIQGGVGASKLIDDISNVSYASGGYPLPGTTPPPLVPVSKGFFARHWLTILVVVILLALIVGAVVYMFVLRKRQQQKKENSEENDGNENPGALSDEELIHKFQKMELQEPTITQKKLTPSVQEQSERPTPHPPQESTQITAPQRKPPKTKHTPPPHQEGPSVYSKPNDPDFIPIDNILRG